MAKQDLEKLIDKVKNVSTKEEINAPIQKVVKKTSTKEELIKPLHIQIPEKLFYDLKQKALERRTSIKNIVIEALKKKQNYEIIKRYKKQILLYKYFYI